VEHKTRWFTHVVNAHSSWILGVSTLADSRRFVTSGADGKIHVWQLDSMYEPSDTFHTDGNNWAITITQNRKPQRLVAEAIVAGFEFSRWIANLHYFY
jgi:WD40 repeat protein